MKLSKAYLGKPSELPAVVVEASAPLWAAPFGPLPVLVDLQDPILPAVQGGGAYIFSLLCTLHILLLMCE